MKANNIWEVIAKDERLSNNAQPARQHPAPRFKVGDSCVVGRYQLTVGSIRRADFLLWEYCIQCLNIETQQTILRPIYQYRMIANSNGEFVGIRPHKPVNDQSTSACKDC